MAKEYEFHPFADIFPLIEGDDFQKLVADIRENGLREDITLHEGKILDGRNRDRACREAGVQARYRKYTGDASPWGLLRYVVSLNVHRRQLNSDQRAACAVAAKELIESLTQAADERRRSGYRQRGLKGKDDDLRQKIDEDAPDDENAGRVTQQLAEAFATNRQYVSDLAKLQESAPEVVDQIRLGQVRLSQIKQEQKRGQAEADRKLREKIIAKAPRREPVEIKYSTIVVDSSWFVPTHDNWLFDLGGLSADEYAAANAHLYLRTRGSVEEIKRGIVLVERWGFAVTDCLTLYGGEKLAGDYFNAVAQTVLFGARGRLALLKEDVPNCQRCEPDKFLRFVESVSPGPRLLLLSDSAPRGWSVSKRWGDVPVVA